MAGKPYTWAVHTSGVGGDSDSGIGGQLLARLLAVVEMCLTPDPAHRCTAAHAVELLRSLQRDVALASRDIPSRDIPSRDIPSRDLPASEAEAGTSRSVTTSTMAAPYRLYDVADIVHAMEALGLDTTPVIAAVGGVTASSLEALLSLGVSFVDGLALKKGLAPSAEGTPPPALVCVTTLLSCGSDKACRECCQP